MASPRRPGGLPAAREEGKLRLTQTHRSSLCDELTYPYRLGHHPTPYVVIFVVVLVSHAASFSDLALSVGDGKRRRLAYDGARSVFFSFFGEGSGRKRASFRAGGRVRGGQSVGVERVSACMRVRAEKAMDISEEGAFRRSKSYDGVFERRTACTDTDDTNERTI